MNTLPHSIGAMLRYLFILIASTWFPLNTLHAQTLQQDSLALVALYNGNGGAAWTVKTNWLSSMPLSSWAGVTVRNNRVVTLVLTNNNLTGTLSSTIGTLTALDTLRLTGNKLSGAVPREIGNLTALRYLSLASNQFTGTLPADFFKMKSLVILYCHNNRFNGPLPVECTTLPNLQELYLNNNQFSGAIPAAFCAMPQLNVLWIYSNQLVVVR